MTSTPPFDLAVGNKWFAIEFNNQAWDLLESDAVAAEQRQELLERAYASCCHWRVVGNVANRVRGLCLVANSEAAYGEPQAALRATKECLKLLESNADQCEDWDAAFVHDSAARANAAVAAQERGRQVRDSDRVDRAFERAQAHYEQARELGGLIKDAQDREVFLSWFGKGEWHGLC